MNSKELASRILRAEDVSSYVRQISSIDFCMEGDDSQTIFIRSDCVNDPTKKATIMKIPLDSLPDEVRENINIEQACAILNEHLESAKYEIIEKIQNTVFGDVVEDVKDSAKDDGFEEVEK